MTSSETAQFVAEIDDASLDLLIEDSDFAPDPKVLMMEMLGEVSTLHKFGTSLQQIHARLKERGVLTISFSTFRTYYFELRRKSDKTQLSAVSDTESRRRAKRWIAARLAGRKEAERNPSASALAAGSSERPASVAVGHPAPEPQPSARPIPRAEPPVASGSLPSEPRDDGLEEWQRKIIDGPSGKISWVRQLAETCQTQEEFNRRMKQK